MSIEDTPGGNDSPPPAFEGPPVIGPEWYPAEAGVPEVQAGMIKDRIEVIVPPDQALEAGILHPEIEQPTDADPDASPLDPKRHKYVPEISSPYEELHDPLLQKLKDEHGGPEGAVGS